MKKTILLCSLFFMVFLGAGCTSDNIKENNTSGQNVNDPAHLFDNTPVNTDQNNKDPLNILNNCDIKGNISSSGEKIYHTPGCNSYVRTQIDESNGERWFCSEDEAEDAGWRKAKNCY